MLDTMLLNTPKKIFSVVGPDVDLDMLRILTAGDRMLAEINGARLFSTSPNPKLSSDHPWTIEHHEPGDFLIISNPLLAEHIRLDYAELLTTGEHQPAVFHKTTGPLISERVPEIQIVLQLISCRMDEAGLESLQPEFDEEGFSEFLEDDRTKLAVLDAFADQVCRLSRGGWRLLSSNRFGLRANIKPEVLRAFRERNYEQLFNVSDEQLTRMAQEFHALNALLQQSSMIQHDPIRTAEVAPFAERRHDLPTVE